MREGDSFLKKIFTKGTPQCAIACALVGVLAALLLLWQGVWRTLLVTVLVALGAFVGGVKDKKEFINSLLEKVGRR